MKSKNYYTHSTEYGIDLKDGKEVDGTLQLQNEDLEPMESCFSKDLTLPEIKAQLLKIESEDQNDEERKNAVITELRNDTDHVVAFEIRCDAKWDEETGWYRKTIQVAFYDGPRKLIEPAKYMYPVSKLV